MQIKYPEIGICGVSCRLCPTHHTRDEHQCGGCKDEHRIDTGCPLLSCAVMKKGVEFCWDCPDSAGCEKWHTALKEGCNAVVTHQRIIDSISFIRENGIEAFACAQKTKERLLNEMLQHYDEGQSVNEYCIAATVLQVEELEAVLTQAWIESPGSRIDARSQHLHSLIRQISG